MAKISVTQVTDRRGGFCASAYQDRGTLMLSVTAYNRAEALGGLLSGLLAWACPGDASRRDDAQQGDAIAKVRALRAA